MPHPLSEKFYKELDEMANLYGLSSIEAEEALYQTLEDYFNTTDILFKGDGFKIDGKYYNFSKKSFNDILSILREKLIQQSSSKIKMFLVNLFKANDNILVCKIVKKGIKNYILVPVIKDKNIHSLKVKVPLKNFSLEKEVNKLPVIVNPKSLRKININTFEVNGCVICKKSVRMHLEKYIKEKLGKLLDDVEVKVKNVFIKENKESRERIIILKINKQVTENVINFIKDYFYLFGYKVILVNHSL